MFLMDPWFLGFDIILYLYNLFCLFIATAVLVGTGFYLESGKMAGSMAQPAPSVLYSPTWKQRQN